MLYKSRKFSFSSLFSLSLSLSVTLCNLQCFGVRGQFTSCLFCDPITSTQWHMALYACWVIQLQMWALRAVGISLGYLQVNHTCLNPETVVGTALQSHNLSSLFLSELLTLLKPRLKVLHWSCISCPVLVRDTSVLLFTLLKFCVQTRPRPPLKVA